MDDNQKIKLSQVVNKDENQIKPEEKKETEEINELKNKIKELDNNWKRALADYQNLVKRSQEEVVSAVSYGNRHLLLKFLEILDHLEEAQKHLADKGLELVISQFKSVLKNEGVVEIEALEKIFDPLYHECLEMRPADAKAMAGEEGKRDNVIVEVLRRGYLFKDKVMRPAKVIVEVKKM
jgi:molecular chaperone GrpE